MVATEQGDGLTEQPTMNNNDWKDSEEETRFKDISRITDPRILARVAESLKHAHHPNFGKGPVDDLGHAASPARWKFLKVYKAPGYPVDPKHEKARAVDAYVNAFNPQPHGVFDREPLKHWLIDNVN